MYGGNPPLHLYLTKESLADLPTMCNLYGFTGMQGNRSHGYGNLSQMWKYLRDHLPLYNLCRWCGASRKEREAFPDSALQLLWKESGVKHLSLTKLTQYWVSFFLFRRRSPKRWSVLICLRCLLGRCRRRRSPLFIVAAIEINL